MFSDMSFPLSFALNLGPDDSNLVLHFNPRVDSGGDIKTIVCNSMENKKWGKPQRDDRFPFQQGEEARVSGRCKGEKQ